MFAKPKYLIPSVVAAVLALAVQAQATSPGEDSHNKGETAEQGHAADQTKNSSGLRSLAAATTHAEQPAKGHGGGHWTYDGQTGPAHWGDISPEFGACKAGRAQSPIDINGGVKAESAPIEFDYHVTPLKLENNGHTVVAHYAPGSGIWVEGERFELLQFHFHAPSEHVINGRPAAMEVHFVHKNQKGELAVVGVMFEQGKENLALSEIWAHLPHGTGPAHPVEGVAVNGRDFLPASPAYYRYMGSLTTPPCSEGVNWYVMTTPIQADFNQVMAFASLFGPNARPAQPLHNRLVLVPGGN